MVDLVSTGLNSRVNPLNFNVSRGAERVVVRLDWASAELVGRAAVRSANVGVDAGVTAERVECVSLR